MISAFVTMHTTRDYCHREIEMKNTMTILGAGHRIAAMMLPFLGLAIAAAWLFGDITRFPLVPYPILLGAGIGLMVVGLAINFISAAFMLRAFKGNRLETRGPYAFSRNPMYASFIMMTIPGLSFVLDNWAVLLVTVVLYAAVRLSIGVEERWLSEKFGETWTAYARQVGSIIPKQW
jgi:protein-S-isoprenylcysteine O-methyltransferase Ste14